MADYIFGNDTITGLPVSSGTTTFAGLADAPYSFNPFAGVTGFTDGGTAGGITLRLIFSDLTGGVNGETLYSVDPTSGVTTATALGGTVLFTTNSATDAVSWLHSVFVIDYSLNDRFRITLKGFNSDAGPAGGANQNFSYRLSCYVRGTMIATPDGARAVETLQIGDLVSTADGGAKPVKWIGHRTYEAAFGAAEPFVRPVLIKAGALGEGLPQRDLRVSPQHGMLIDGVMVPAAALVNGVSILRDAELADVQYFHIETDAHDVVLAEGAPAETFIDIASRAMFDNADEYGLLYGSAATEVAQRAPRVEEGYQLAAIRRRLDRIAGIAPAAAGNGMLKGNIESLTDGVLQGWVVDTGAADPVEADVLVDGEVVARVLANRYRADLDQAGLNGGRCAFSVTLPPSADSLDRITLRRVADGSTLGAVVAAYAAG